MKVIAFGASTSAHSINKQFAAHTLTHFKGHDTTLLDLNDFEMPLFSVDREHNDGHPQAAHDFLAAMAAADLIVCSMAEHNGNFTAAFKNLLDWTSRVHLKVFEKPMLLLSTSPGGHGGGNSMEAALKRFPRHGAIILGHFSLPAFNDNFDPEKGITDDALKAEYLQQVEAAKAHFETPETNS